MFTNYCHTLLTQSASSPVTSIEDFNNIFIKIAYNTIPKAAVSIKKSHKPWFNDSCITAIHNRKRALRNLQHHPTCCNIETLRIARAKARRTIR